MPYAPPNPRESAENRALPTSAFHVAVLAFALYSCGMTAIPEAKLGLVRLSPVLPLCSAKTSDATQPCGTERCERQQLERSGGVRLHAVVRRLDIFLLPYGPYGLSSDGRDGVLVTTTKDSLDVLSLLRICHLRIRCPMGDYELDCLHGKAAAHHELAEHKMANKRQLQ